MTIPGLREDLAMTYRAWQAGDLERTHGHLFSLAIAGGLGVCVLLLGWRVRRRTG